MKKYGFTLSEVLITLGIIGVIAAFTIPNIFTKIQDKQFKTAYKKDVAIITEAMKLIYLNTDSGWQQGYNSAKYLCLLSDSIKMSQNYLNCKAINMIQRDLTSFGDWKTKNHYQWHEENAWFTKDGLPMQSTQVYGYLTIKLHDGTLISSPCTNTIYIDVNGKSRPNTIGRDIFALPVKDGDTTPTLSIPKNGFNPQNCYGEKSTSVVITKNNYKQDCETGKGWGCSFLYLEN